MLDIRVLKKIDKMLQKCCENEQPFGGKLILLAGDRRQLVPASGSNFSIFSSEYMDLFYHMELKTQMRQSSDQFAFVEWLQKVGENDIKIFIILIDWRWS